MELQVGQIYQVRTIKLLNYGVIVKLSDNSTELIHISKLSDKFIRSVEEAVSVDKTYNAIGVKGTKKPIELSLIIKESLESKQGKQLPEDKPSLDDMIAKCNRAFEDKIRNKDQFHKPSKRKRYGGR